MNNQNNLFFLLIGAAITFISTNIIEWMKKWRERREKSNNFKLFVKLELSVIAKTLDQLKTALSYASYYEYALLDRTKESVNKLENAHNDIIYFSDSKLKEKFIDLIAEVSTYIVKTRGIQELFYSERDKAQAPRKGKKKTLSDPMENVWDNFNKRSLQASIDYVEIKRRLEELIKTLI